MEALKDVEHIIEADVKAALVTENIVGSVTIPSSPGMDVSFPYICLLGVLVVCLVLSDRAISKRTPTIIVTKEFKQFQRSYINVYLCALGAEWLQVCALCVRHYC